jgi:hypothetical protein
MIDFVHNILYFAILLYFSQYTGKKCRILSYYIVTYRPISRQRLGRYIPMVMNTQATIG